jgi:hypothetical protein
MPPKARCVASVSDAIMRIQFLCEVRRASGQRSLGEGNAESLLPGGRGAQAVISEAMPPPPPVGKRSRCTEPPLRRWGLWGLDWRGAANRRRIRAVARAVDGDGVSRDTHRRGVAGRMRKDFDGQRLCEKRWKALCRLVDKPPPIHRQEHRGAPFVDRSWMIMMSRSVGRAASTRAAKCRSSARVCTWGSSTARHR